MGNIKTERKGANEPKLILRGAKSDREGAAWSAGLRNACVFTTPTRLSYCTFLSCLYLSKFYFILEQFPVLMRKYLKISASILNKINDL